jgi:DNA-binding PadR family transcriptional regulator
MTEAELTILSLVAEGPRYGYEIQQIIDDRGLREWLAIGFSSIYYVLNKLENQKMLTSQLRAEGRGPARKIYQITEAGRGVLQTAVSDLLRQPRSLGSGFELGLANMTTLKPEQVYKVLTYHHDDLKRQLDLVEKSWQRHQDGDAPEVADHIRALYTHSIAIMHAELVWLNEFIEDWCKRYPAVKSIDPDKLRQDDPHIAETVVHRHTTPDPAKMIQRLRRPKSQGE